MSYILDTETTSINGAVSPPGGWANNQVGHVSRFIDEYGGITRWSSELNDWLVWGRSKGVWTKDVYHDAERRMQDSLTRQIDDGHAFTITASLVKNCLSLSKARLAVSIDAFDQDPWTLNTPSGPVDLRTGTLRDHEIGDLFLKITTGIPDWELNEKDEKVIVWNPDKYPTFVGHLQFMTQWKTPEEAEDVERVLRRFCGMSGVGSQDETPHLVLNLSGRGRNGKSVFVDAVAHAYGPGYAKAAPKSLLTRRADAHSTEEAGMEGVRFAYLEEIKMIQAQVFKDLTGGGTLTARRMRADDRTFPKTWNIVLNGNDPVNVQGDGSDGMKDRLLKVDLGAASEEGLRKDGVPTSLKDEADGILSWAIVGCRDWVEAGRRKEGLGIAEWMLASTAQERDDDDVLGNFINDCYKQEEHRQDMSGKVVPCLIIGSVFVHAYNEYRKGLGYAGEQPPAVYQELRSRGFEVKKGTGNKTCVYGLRTTLEDGTFGGIIERIGPMHLN